MIYYTRMRFNFLFDCHFYTLLNLTKQQDNIDKIDLYATDLSEPKYEFLIKKCENAGRKHLNDSNAFIKCSDTRDDIYENIDD